MIIARWNNEVIARSDDTVIVERNHYFPMSDVTMDLLKETDHHTECPWKGTASYYDITVEGKTNSNAAWIYKDPKEEAEMVRDRIAFWKGVEVSEEL